MLFFLNEGWYKQPRKREKTYLHMEKVAKTNTNNVWTPSGNKCTKNSLYRSKFSATKYSEKNDYSKLSSENS